MDIIKIAPELLKAHDFIAFDASGKPTDPRLIDDVRHGRRWTEWKHVARMGSDGPQVNGYWDRNDHLRTARYLIVKRSS